MSWQKWILVAVIGVSTLISIATVGEQRKPTTPMTAAFVTVANAAMIALVVTG